MTQSSEKNRPSSFFKRHRLLAVIGITIVVLLAVILLLLPPALRWGMAWWLESHGRLEAQIENVDLNIFDGNLVVHSLVAERPGEGGFKWGRAAVEVAWWPLFKKRIRFDDISFTNAQLSVVEEENGDLYLGGIRVKDEAAESRPSSEQNGWEFGFGEIDLKEVVVIYKTPAFSRQLLIRDAHVDPMQSWNPSSSGNFNADLVVEKGTIHIEGSAKPYSPEAVVRGQIVAADVPVTWADPWLQEMKIINAGGTLKVDSEFFLAFEEELNFTLDGMLALQQIKGDLPRINVHPQTLTWQGKTQAVFPAQTGAPRVTANGTLSAQTPYVQFSPHEMTARAKVIAVDGEFEFNTEGGTNQADFFVRGEARAEDIIVLQGDTQSIMAEVKILNLQDLLITGTDTIEAGSAKVTDAGFLKTGKDNLSESGNVFSFQELSLQKPRVDLKQKHIGIDLLAMDNAQGRLIRNKKGDFEVIERLAAIGGEEKKKPSGQPWTYTLNQATIGQGSAVQFVDRSLATAVDVILSNIKIKIEDVNSASGDPLRVDIQAELGKYSSLKAQGTVIPFAEKVSMDINGEIKQFSLPEIRGYAEQSLNYTINSGQLYADFDLLVDDGRMNSVIKLFITRLILARVAEENSGFVEQNLGMPLSVVLKLIRDGDENISLQLPVTGRLSDPNVGLDGVIGKAVENATLEGLKTAALSYFAPLGAAYAASKIFGHMVALRLNPITFDAAQDQLDATDKEYLRQVVEKLKERPEASLLLCGKASEADRLALRQMKGGKQKPEDSKDTTIPDARLLNLAERRAEKTRTYLVKLGIGSERLILCAPEIQKGDEGKPQVELAI